MNIQAIQNMLDKGELAFVLPHQLDNSIIDKVNIYNAFRFQSIKDYTYEIKHEYQDIDYLVSEYYLTCLDENLITYRNFFKLLEEMILRYPSISFSSFFSDRTLFFNVWKSNFYLHYFRCVSQKYRHNELAIYNMSYYLCDIYENNRKWKNGKFNLDFLNQQNREFIEELSDGV